MKRIVFLNLVLSLITQVLSSQIQNPEIVNVQVNGNCGMCEIRIEQAAFKKKVAKADWNENTKIAQITYDKRKTTLADILKRIALAGYDNELFLAPTDTYAKLPGCCQYERKLLNSIKSQSNKLQSFQTASLISENIDSEKVKLPIQKLQHESIKLVFNAYFELKNALVKSSGVLTSQKSNELVNALKEVDSNMLLPELKSTWTNIEPELTRDALLISKTQDIEQQRKHFISLSSNMYTLLKQFKSEEPVYYQFCPMANDGIGANWLSKEAVIKNPYFGNKMLSCGKTVEIIKQ